MRRYLALLLLLFACGCPVVPDDGGDDDKKPPVDLPAVVHTQFVSYAASMAALSDDAVKRLKSGEIDTQQKLRDFWNENQAQIEKDASQSIGDAWMAKLYDDKWSVEKAIEILTEQAEGYRRVK